VRDRIDVALGRAEVARFEQVDRAPRQREAALAFAAAALRGAHRLRVEAQPLRELPRRRERVSLREQRGRQDVGVAGLVRRHERAIGQRAPAVGDRRVPEMRRERAEGPRAERRGRRVEPGERLGEHRDELRGIGDDVIREDDRRLGERVGATELAREGRAAARHLAGLLEVARAEQRARLPEQDVAAARAIRRIHAVERPERALVEMGRLGEREPALGVLGGAQCRVDRAPADPRHRLAEVVRDRRRELAAIGRGERGERVAGAFVQLDAAGRGRLLVDRFLDQRVGERRSQAAGLADQRGAARLLERLEEIALGQIRDTPERREGKVPAEHGRGAQDVRSARGELGEPGRGPTRARWTAPAAGRSCAGPPRCGRRDRPRAGAGRRDCRSLRRRSSSTTSRGSECSLCATANSCASPGPKPSMRWRSTPGMRSSAASAAKSG
jgi:hypothetical protein